jgi:hypothetical protein
MILLPGAAGSSESKLPPHQPRDSKPTRQARDSLTTSILHCAKLTTHHTLTTTDTTEHHFTTTTEPQPETTTKLTATKQVITTNSKLPLPLPCARSPSLCTPATTTSSTSGATAAARSKRAQTQMCQLATRRATTFASGTLTSAANALAQMQWERSAALWE